MSDISATWKPYEGRAQPTTRSHLPDSVFFFPSATCRGVVAPEW